MDNAPAIRRAPATRRGALLQRMASLVARPARSRQQKSYALCVFKPDRIGDFVLALGAVQLLVDEFGEENCVLVVSPIAKALVDIEFPRAAAVVVSPFEVPLRAQALLGALRKRLEMGAFRFDALACLRHQRVRFQNLILHWVDTDASFGLANQSGYHLGDPEYSFANEDPYPTAGEGGLPLELEAHRTVLQRVLGRQISAGDVLPRFRSVQRHPGDHLLVCPFASSPLRDIPERLLIDTLMAGRTAWQTPTLLSCAPEQRRRAECLLKTLRGAGLAARLLERKGLHGFLADVAAARAVLTADTSTAHIATALDVPTVVILGGGHYGQFGPWHRSDKQLWLSNRLPCFHCQWLCTKSEPFCITGVTSEAVVEAMQVVLGKAKCGEKN